MEQFFTFKKGEVKGFVGGSFSSEESDLLYDQIQKISDYVGSIIGILAEGGSDQFSIAARVVQRLVKLKEAQLWCVMNKNLPYYVRAAAIFPEQTDIVAYPTVVINLNKFVPFDRNQVPLEASIELMLGIGDLPGARKLLENRGIRILDTAGFLARIYANPDGQRFLLIRDPLDPHKFNPLVA